MKRCILIALVGCGPAPAPALPSAAQTQLSNAADARMVAVPAGRYIAGSTEEERAAAYDDYLESAGQNTARERKWFEHEDDRRLDQLPAFRIDLMPVMQVEYAELVAQAQVPVPAIDEAAWKVQGFAQDYASEVARFAWRDGRPPAGREDHPVVLVTHADAERYCRWRGEQTGEPRRLPTSAEYEKASRGDAGLIYPWGNTYEADKLNSAVAGPRDTTPVGTYTTGASPYGVLDLAGNVFQWTSTSSDGGTKRIVKGSAWEDFAGMGRGAAGHGRAPTIRHVIVGFRCAADAR